MDLSDVDIASFAALLGRAAAGPRDRGEGLAATGAVQLTDVSPLDLSAVVQGTHPYRVSVSAGAQRWSCTCPYAADGSFCKHVVATICAAVEPELSARSASEYAADGPTDLERITAHVDSLDHAELVGLVVEQARFDRGLADRLLAAAMAQAGEKIDVADWKKRVTTAFRGPGGHIDYRHAAEWAAGVHDTLDVIRSLLGAGYATEVAALAEHAHRRAESAVQRVDDSGGEILDIVAVIQELHVSAAEAGAYTPKALGKRLAKLELSAQLDTFHRSAVEYADVLGDEGLEAFRLAVDAAWEKLPPNPDRYGPAFRVRHARVGHAMATRDPNRYVEAFAGERMLPEDLVVLIDMLIADGRLDEATDWADRGLEEWANHFGVGPLRAVRARLHRVAGNDHDVEDLYWNAFVQRPSSRSVQELLTNSLNEAAMRARILELVESSLTEARRDQPDEASFRPRGSSPAVRGEVGAEPLYRPKLPVTTDAAIEVLLELGEVEGAWSTALEFGAGKHLWNALVGLRSDDHPQDAIRWALVSAAMEIDHRDRRHYRRAVKILREAERRHADANEATRSFFDDGVQTILAADANKPSLIDEFGKVGWVTRARSSSSPLG